MKPISWNKKATRTLVLSEGEEDWTHPYADYQGHGPTDGPPTFLVGAAGTVRLSL